MATKYINAKVGFYPSWWYKNYGISYNRQYYYDPDYRVDAFQKQQRILYERFGDVGMGKPDPEPEPFIDYGMVLLPEVFGCEVKFFDDAIPWAVPANLSEEEIFQLKVPDITQAYPMTEIIKQMDYLEQKYGRVTGNINTTGVLNLGLKIRGDQLYIDFFENPDLVHHLFNICTETIIQLARYVKSRTGTLASSVTPMAPPEMYVLPDCTVVQISRQAFEEFVLPYENRLSATLQPFGIHHCGKADHMLEGYAKVNNLSFLEVGPMTDLKRLRELMPDVFVNARIDPVRMLNCSPEEIAGDVKRIIDIGAPYDKLSIDAVGCDYGTPDANVRAMLKTAREYSATKIAAQQKEEIA
ncbi:Uroporphyrinogen decarboxylase [Neomoorella glycerini]|uniref:Uroporphyrinogen decarboxylase n=1 Tax=Neomoorella glycerini TaxID=55779 RepID=A0A6I5ZPW9_9FIRM|nr:uroporphyrinogen decarboxylase family protein [Moorella glycerini]QGP91571.1 Uroporphyrinogen decarboxylase [Moorella glycerini]